MPSLQTEGELPCTVNLQVDMVTSASGRAGYRGCYHLHTELQMGRTQSYPPPLKIPAVIPLSSVWLLSLNLQNHFASPALLLAAFVAPRTGWQLQICC